MDLITKPRSKSLVWMYFGFKSDGKGKPLKKDEIICRLCRKIVLAKGGNTTNLRSHLKRRHQTEFINPTFGVGFSSSPGTGGDTQGFEHNHEDLIEELQCLSSHSQADPNQNYVPDAVLPPGEPWLLGGPSRASLSLPSCLYLSEESHTNEVKVYAKCHLQVGVMFGPYIGEIYKGHLPDNLKYAWAIRDEAAFVYVDGLDVDKSNWMRFVTYTSSEEEHNLSVFQFYRRIYYKVSQPISEGTELKVWVGRDYASLLGLGIGENMKCDFGDKESFLRPLRDIQLISLPEPSSSSHWSDQRQSQSPMPIISEVTSINPDVIRDTGSTSVPSSSLCFFPNPGVQTHEKYDFLPGTERLVSNPNVPNINENNAWFFFGFEPDHTGRPLDKNTAICKLCGDRVGCAEGVAEIQNHMVSKHHIRPRETSKERLSTGPAVPSSPLGLFPIPGVHPYDKYDFLPGTERLVSNTNMPITGDNSAWYFFGFEPDHTGRPVDKNTAICKLCGDRVGCGEGEVQSHLINKHHIRPRDTSKERPSAGMLGALGSLQIPGVHPYDKYDFLPGTERLVSNPNVPITGDNSAWYFFGFEPDHIGRPVDKNTAICKLCGDRVGCAEGDVQSHLINKHHIRPRETSKERPSAGQRPSLPAPSSNVTDNIIHFVIMDLQPPAIVEGDGFKHLIQNLLPFNKDLPSQNQLEYLLRELHTRSKCTMAQMLRTKAETPDYTAPLEAERCRRGKDVPHLVNFSVDLWFHTWQGNTEMYLSLWAHYIDSSFTPHNKALSTQKVAKSGLNLKAVESQVRAMAEEWGISQANLSVLGGEGWNEIRAVPVISENVGEPSVGNLHPNSTTFLEKDEGSSEESQAEQSQNIKLPTIPCFFSAVQSCIDELMSHNGVSKVLIKFQNILSAIFVQPTQGVGLIEDYTEKLLQAMTKEEQVEVKLWAHSRPSWNKLYLLLNTLLKHKSLVRDITKELKDEPGFDSTSSANSTSAGPSLRTEWKVIEDLCLVLKPLDVACQTLAKEDFPRLSLIKPILTGLVTRHLVTRPGDSPILKEVKTMMRYNLSSWYDKPVVNKVLCVACALDPQFHGLGFMSEKEQTDTMEWLKSEAVRISKESKTKKRGKKPHKIKRSPSPSSPGESRRRSKRLKDCQPINFHDIDTSDGEETDDNDNHNDSDWVEPPPDDGLSGMEFLLGDLYTVSTNKTKQRSVEESVDNEISILRADNGAPLGVEPLQWWRTKAMQSPLLAAVAQAYLASPAVAGNATQDFLQEGAGTSRGKRSNIPPDNLDAILFLHHNNIKNNKLKLFF